MSRSRSTHVPRVAGPLLFIGITVVWGVLLTTGWVLVFWPDVALAPGDDGTVGVIDRSDHSLALTFGGSSPLVRSGGQPWSLVARIARFGGVGLTVELSRISQQIHAYPILPLFYSSEAVSAVACQRRRCLSG